MKKSISKLQVYVTCGMLFSLLFLAHNGVHGAQTRSGSIVAQSTADVFIKANDILKSIAPKTAKDVRDPEKIDQFAKELEQRFISATAFIENNKSDVASELKVINDALSKCGTVRLGLQTILATMRHKQIMSDAEFSKNNAANQQMLRDGVAALSVEREKVRNTRFTTSNPPVSIPVTTFWGGKSKDRVATSAERTAPKEVGAVKDILISLITSLMDSCTHVQAALKSVGLEISTARKRPAEKVASQQPKSSQQRQQESSGSGAASSSAVTPLQGHMQSSEAAVSTVAVPVLPEAPTGQSVSSQEAPEVQITSGQDKAGMGAAVVTPPSSGGVVVTQPVQPGVVEQPVQEPIMEGQPAQPEPAEEPVANQPDAEEPGATPKPDEEPAEQPVVENPVVQPEPDVVIPDQPAPVDSQPEPDVVAPGQPEPESGVEVEIIEIGKPASGGGRKPAKSDTVRTQPQQESGAGRKKGGQQTGRRDTKGGDVSGPSTGREKGRGGKSSGSQEPKIADEGVVVTITGG